MVLLKRLAWKLGNISRGYCSFHTQISSLLTQHMKREKRYIFKDQVFNNARLNFMVEKRLFCSENSVEDQKYQDVIKAIENSKIQSDFDNTHMAKTNIIKNLENVDHVNIRKSSSSFNDDGVPNDSNVNSSEDDLNTMDTEKNSDFSYYQVAEDIEEFGFNDGSEIHEQIQSRKELSISLESKFFSNFHLIQ